MHSFECKIDDLENYSSTLTEMHYEYEEFVVESWKDLADDIGRCTLLLLLLSFLETSLHEIAIWFCDEKGIEVKKHSRINNIVHYLQLIGECCNCDIISALESEMDILKMAINVRNKFVHKPWDTQFNRSKMFKLSEIINSLAKVFQTIEIQAISAGILHEDTFAF